MHRRLVLMLVLLAALGHFNRVGISVAGSEIFIAKYGISEVNMGWIYTAFLLCYTAAMLPGGWLIDRLGSMRALTLYGICMGTCVACTGAIGWLGLSVSGLWLALMVIRSITGVCSVPLHPGAAHAVSDFVPTSSRATANGLVTAGALIGIALCYPLYGWMNDHWGWQTSFIVGGLSLLALGIAWTSGFDQRMRPRQTQPDDRHAAASSGSTWLWNQKIWLIAISYAAYGYFQYLFFYWMEHYFSEVLKVEPLQARWLTAIVMISQAVGMGLGGYWTDWLCRRFGLKAGRRLVVMSGMGLGALFGVLGANLASTSLVVTCLALAMGCQGLCEGVFWTAVTEVDEADRGKSAAFMNTGGNLGGLISPVVAPLIANSFGWPVSIAVACFVIATGGVLWVYISPSDADVADC